MISDNGGNDLNSLEPHRSCRYEISMSTATAEIIQVCEALPPEKQSEVIDFARFLLAREEDDRWERSLAETRPRPRFDAFLRESAAEADEPLDPRRL